MLPAPSREGSPTSGVAILTIAHRYGRTRRLGLSLAGGCAPSLPLSSTLALFVSRAMPRRRCAQERRPCRRCRTSCTVDGRPAIDGRAGALLHRLRSRRGRRHQHGRRGSAPSSRMRRGGSGRCRSRSASATTRSTARGSSAAIAARAQGAVLAPLDDDFDVLRRQLWLATDAAYKRAVNVFARKKAAFQNRTSTDALPDFSKEAPVETVLPPVAPGGSNREWLDGIRQISAVFASSADIMRPRRRSPRRTGRATS